MPARRTEVAASPPPGPAPGDARGRIAEIDVLRGVAILMVLMQHMPDNLLYWSSAFGTFLSRYGQGWTGVDLFFVISGFVITRVLLPAVEGAPRGSGLGLCVAFYRQRAWRLLPSAWLWLGLILLGCVVFNRSGAFRSVEANVSAIVAALLNLMNFHEAETFGRGDSGLVFPYWSLSLEEQFYALLPIALLTLRGWVMIPLAAMLLSCVQVVTPLGMMTRTGGLACGVLLAWGFRHRPAVMAALRPDALAALGARRIALPAAIVLLLVLLGSDTLRIVSFRLLPITLLAGCLVWVAAYDRDLLMADGWLRRGLEWVGLRSYSLYLVHIPVFASAHELVFRFALQSSHPKHLGSWLYVVGTLVACLVVADLNYRLVEIPTRWRARRQSPHALPSLRETVIAR